VSWKVLARVCELCEVLHLCERACLKGTDGGRWLDTYAERRRRTHRGWILHDDDFDGHHGCYRSRTSEPIYCTARPDATSRTSHQSSSSGRHPEEEEDHQNESSHACSTIKSPSAIITPPPQKTLPYHPYTSTFPNNFQQKTPSKPHHIHSTTHLIPNVLPLRPKISMGITEEGQTDQTSRDTGGKNPRYRLE
jgi:hypothetical protein